jgi:hypothetical protein
MNTTDNTLEQLPDGIILLTQRGYQTAASVVQFEDQINTLTVQRHQEGKKALILVDMSGVSGHDPDAREQARKSIKGEYDGLAIFGSDLSVRMVVNWIIQVIGQGDRIKFFDDRDEAVRWLHSHES